MLVHIEQKGLQIVAMKMLQELDTEALKLFADGEKNKLGDNKDVIVVDGEPARIVAGEAEVEEVKAGEQNGPSVKRGPFVACIVCGDE